MLKTLNAHYLELTPNQKIGTLIHILKEKRKDKVLLMQEEIKIYFDKIMQDPVVFQSNKYKKRLSKVIKGVYNFFYDDITIRYNGESFFHELPTFSLFLSSLINHGAIYDRDVTFYTYRDNKITTLFILVHLLSISFDKKFLSHDEVVSLFQKILNFYPNGSYQNQQFTEFLTVTESQNYDIWSYIAAYLPSSFLNIIFDNFKHLKFYIPKKNSFLPQFITEFYNSSIEHINILNDMLDDFIQRHSKDLNKGLDEEQCYAFNEYNLSYHLYLDKSNLESQELKNFNVIYTCLLYGNTLLIDKIFSQCQPIFNNQHTKYIQDLIITNHFISDNDKIKYLEKISKKIDYYSMTQAMWGRFSFKNEVLLNYLLKHFDINSIHYFYNGDNLLLNSLRVGNITNQYLVNDKKNGYDIKKEYSFYLGWAEYFIENNINIIADSRGIHPIHKVLVYKKGKIKNAHTYVHKVWNLLKEKNIDFQIRTKKGNNALHFAFSMNYEIENILFLINENIKLSEKNKYGKSAYDYFLKYKDKIKSINQYDLTKEFNMIEKRYLEETISSSSRGQENGKDKIKI
jgi:hypothetical protein